MQYSVVSIEYSDTELYQILAPEDALVVPARSLGVPPVGEILRRWGYVSGTQPKLNAPIGTILCNASRALVQLLTDGMGNPVRERYILLESDSTAVVSRRSGSGSATLTEGEYVDIILDGGAFDSFTTPATFNPSSPPSGSEGLLEAVNDIKDERGIP